MTFFLFVWLICFCKFRLTLPPLIPQRGGLTLLPFKIPPVSSCHHDFDQTLYRQLVPDANEDTYLVPEK